MITGQDECNLEFRQSLEKGRLLQFPPVCFDMLVPQFFYPGLVMVGNDDAGGFLH